MKTFRKRRSRVHRACLSALLTLLVVAPLALAACGGETASGTTPPAASPGTKASPGPVVWACPRPAVSYSRANPPSTVTKPGYGPTSGRTRKAGTIGWEFEPKTDIKVIALGCFDAGRDGLARSHRVGIFAEKSGKLLASVTVRPRSRLEGFFRWESLKTPLVLKAERSYVVGTEDLGTLETVYTRRGWPEAEWGPQPGERWAEALMSRGSPVSVGAPALVVSRPSEAAFTAPTLGEDLWNDAPWFSPNFTFRPASDSSPDASDELANEHAHASGLPQQRIVGGDGVYRWNTPGDASPTQTRAVVCRYAAAFAAGRIPSPRLYAADATWDFWPMGRPLRGTVDIQRVYREIASESNEHPFLSDAEPGWAWAKRSASYHLLAAPGVAMLEGTFQFTSSVDAGPYLVLLAVDGGKIAHEEIFAGDRGRPVKFCGSDPGPGDTAQVAARVGAALGAAFAARDRAALRALLARDVLFRDVTYEDGVSGWEALLPWWGAVAPAKVVKITSRTPIAGPGWAVVRWTGRRVYKNNMLPGVTFDESRNGATVIEVRGGKVVRMTVYLEPGDGGGSILQPQ